MILRIVSVVFASFLFFLEASIAADTRFVELATCVESKSLNDSSLLIRKSVDKRLGCGHGYPAKVTLVDMYFGFETTTRTVHGVTAPAPRVIEPGDDVFATHRPCRVVYPAEAVVVEWLVPSTEQCSGRPAGSYYRVYTPSNEICLRPSGQCIPVAKLSPKGQQRFRDVMQVTYSATVASH